jgi:deoxyribonuclease V
MNAVASPARLKDWRVTTAEARAIQNDLRGRLDRTPLDVDALEVVAGADVSFNRGSSIMYAAFVVLRLPSLEVVDRAGVVTTATFPYVPGLLSFREIPPLLEAWETLKTKPDALIADGHGYSHPRRFGFACHLGMALGLPTAGCAKSILVGTHGPLGNARGDQVPLVDHDEEIAAVLRTRPGVKPIYVSVGDHITQESAVALVLRCTKAVRVPETTRHAHEYVNEMRRNAAIET